MVISIAHLGPVGTNAETAALAYAHWLEENQGKSSLLCPCPSIAQTLHSVARGDTNKAVVPVENSTEGSVASTLDTLWQLDRLQIQQEVVLPIIHAFFSRGTSLNGIKTVYSHPQALAQCQRWLQHNLPNVALIPTNSTAEALQKISLEPTAGAIAAPRAVKLYNVPILVNHINDYADNCTRFWVMTLNPTPTVGSRISLAFSVPANVPGSLMKPLQVFAQRNINLSRIESRPTKRSLGEYVFYLDVEGNQEDPNIIDALNALTHHTEVLKIYGSYPVLLLQERDLEQL
ncbi:prephenate dehydratase [Crocosphaera subtropica ATCC 51142]|uniref:Prephenate dehydratase n=1 Tax=Crocosphaera subtropica (strain ATCC 51142 / BH68) TaxID=43989 RepID=B1WW86_CROS5|nr:prephenate dehydratase [Crocosphaera subtropica]ACB54014.1 prephenate dehydratase [Crocosphaera subtropica ATCC 51142]